MAKYGLYKNKTYLLDIFNNVLELTSRESEDINNGFQEYIDVTGKKHNNIFTKEVSIDDIEFAYELEFKVVYKGIEFEPWAIGKFILENNQLSLFTDSPAVAEQYEFMKQEQFVFKKEIPLDDLDALIEIKKPILKFKDMNKVVTRIEKKDIRDYLENLIE